MVDTDDFVNEESLNYVMNQLKNIDCSSTLIESKNNPVKFPNLIVRVWVFSAYFNDLPEEYKNILIDKELKSGEVK